MISGQAHTIYVKQERLEQMPETPGAGRVARTGDRGRHTARRRPKAAAMETVQHEEKVKDVEQVRTYPEGQVLCGACGSQGRGKLKGEG